MTTQTLAVEVPAELVALLGSVKEAAARAKESLVLDMLRSEEISQGKAAELLGITRYDILDLMARYKIESGPKTIDELHQEIETARRFAKARD